MMTVGEGCVFSEGIRGLCYGDRITGDFVHDEMSLEVSIKLLFTKKLIEKMALL